MVTRSRERRLPLKRDEIDRKRRILVAVFVDEKNVFYEKWFDSFFFFLVREKRSSSKRHHRNFIESRNRAKYMQISSRRSTGDTLLLCILILCRASQFSYRIFQRASWGDRVEEVANI